MSYIYVYLSRNSIPGCRDYKISSSVLSIRKIMKMSDNFKRVKG